MYKNVNWIIVNNSETFSKLKFTNKKIHKIRAKVKYYEVIKETVWIYVYINFWK